MFYILNSTCSDPVLARYLSLFDSLLRILQIVVPIVLIVGLTIEVTKLVINPEEKKAPKALVNRIVAAVVFFFLPIIVDVALYITLEIGLMTNSDINIAECWEEAKAMSITMDSSEWVYYEVESSNNYEEIDYNNLRRPASSNISTGDNDQAVEVVNYALSFVGGRYVWGGTDPNTGADCSGFVGYVYNHFGITLPRTTSGMKSAVESGQLNTVPESEARASDLVLYNGHVAMLTGNSTEIVHAANENLGIITQSSYKYDNVLYFIRLV